MLLAAVPVTLAALVGLVLVAFGLPAVKAAPHDLPLGVAGPKLMTEQLTSALAQRDPGAFDVRVYDDEVALTRAIENREVYGGLLATPRGSTVLTASAASPVVAQSLIAMGTEISRQSGGTGTPTVRDVVPLTRDDPRGAGLGAALLPLVIGAILPAVVFTRLGASRRVMLAAGAVYAAVAGLAFAAVLHFGFGSIAGNFWLEAGVFAATIGAGMLALLGLHRVLGMVGLGLGAALLVLVGNPLSGAQSAPEFLASPWREIGQSMPPGAGSQLLRSVAFFDGAGAKDAWIVIGAWALAGLLLLALPSRRRSEG
ncbi:hypothetical protein [Knoellia remsis]|uniref:hypothetical protein n=1 Tax=Knoellia remsis TaxID=407159 RepID=UPI0011B2870A|nr:hypothetical protein [Knoellia remsis]